MAEFKPGCGFCKNTGWIVARHQSLVGVYGFRCGCGFGLRWSDKIPVWSSKWAEAFTPDTDDAPPIAVKRPDPPPPPAPKFDTARFKADFKARASGDFDEEDVPF
ncbi:MAG: hypothetical protein EBZ69_01680 [Alphaproteobacteria bacterium]|nr:hypothetical protein [Alphaproteobacteria bacterium]